MARKLIVGVLLAVLALSSFGIAGAVAPTTIDLSNGVQVLLPPGQTVTATTDITQVQKIVIPFKAKHDHPVIGFSQCTMNHPWRVAMVNGNVDWAKKNWPEAEVIVTDGQNTAAKQVADVDDLLSREIDILLISPLQSDPLTPAVKKALDAGIPVIVLDRNVNIAASVFMGGNNILIGESAGKFVGTKLNGKGNVIEIQGTAGASATVDRKAGFETGLKAFPDIKIAASQTADYLREPAIKFMEDMLQKYPAGQIQAVYAHNDEMALGAIKAIKAANRQKEIMVVGIDGQNEAFEAIKAGDLAATFVYPYCAPDGMMIAKAVFTGQPVEAKMTLPTTQVDATNIDQMLGKGF
jgi:ribose transport system substrate-binding protein